MIGLTAQLGLLLTLFIFLPVCRLLAQVGKAISVRMCRTTRMESSGKMYPLAARLTQITNEGDVVYSASISTFGKDASRWRFVVSRPDPR